MDRSTWVTGWKVPALCQTTWVTGWNDEHLRPPLQHWRPFGKHDPLKELRRLSKLAVPRARGYNPDPPGSEE